MGDEIDKVQKTILDFDSKRGAARLGVLGTGGNAIQFTDADQANLGNAQSRLKELQTEQKTLEQQTMVADAEEKKKLAESMQKAKLAQIEAGFANELSLYKAEHSRADQENEASYVKGLESLAAYYDRKKQLAAESSKKEIDSLTAERARVLAAPTKDGAEKIANQTKAADLANKIAIARVNAEKTAQQLTNEGAQKQEELDKKVLDFQSQIARAQGLKFDEASERIAAEALEMARTLKEAGIAPDQVDAMIAKFKAAATQQAQFAGMKSSGQGAVSALTEDEEDIRLKNLAVVADVKIAELERARIPVLQALANQMKAAAVGPEQIKEADDFAKGVDRIAEAAKKSAVSMESFKDQASQAIKGDLANFLGSITQARSVGQAFAQLANSVVGSIQRIVAQMLIELVMRKLIQAVTHQDQGATGVATAAAKGAAQAAPLIMASGTMTTAGGVIITAGIGLGVSAEALQAAATTLLIANSMSAGAGMAGGGFVTGPGSGTSDSIPARLSAGEFVVRAAAVQSVGLDTLSAINRGFRIPGIRGMSIPRFADGGLVSRGSGSSGVDLNIGLDLAEGLILKHLSSKKAQKIVLTHIGNNPKAVSKALSRGQS